MIKSTEEFEKALKEMRFLKGDTTDLLKYARNVNSHFANKKCQDVIVAARSLMTSEIHNTVKVTVNVIHSSSRGKSIAIEEGLSRPVEPGDFCGALSTLEYLGILANHSFKPFFNNAQVG